MTQLPPLIDVTGVRVLIRYVVELTFQVEGSSKPSCVAECIYRAYT